MSTSPRPMGITSIAMLCVVYRDLSRQPCQKISSVAVTKCSEQSLVSLNNSAAKLDGFVREFVDNVLDQPPQPAGYFIVQKSHINSEVYNLLFLDKGDQNDTIRAAFYLL